MMANVFLFGISGGEILIILLVVLLLFGPSKIPEIARLIGRGINEVKKVQREINTEIQRYSADVEKEARKIRQDIDELKKDMEKSVDQDAPEKREYNYDQYGLHDEYSRSVGMPRPEQSSAKPADADDAAEKKPGSNTEGLSADQETKRGGESLADDAPAGYGSENFESRTGAEPDSGTGQARDISRH